MKSRPAEVKDRIAKAGLTHAPVETIDLPPALQFTHNGTVVTRAKRVFGGHRFTDAEVAALLAGETIEIRGPLKTWPWKVDQWDEVIMVRIQPSFLRQCTPSHLVRFRAALG